MNVERAGSAWHCATDRLGAVRTAPRRRRFALVLALGAGLALAWVHWLGLFVAGALVGLVSENLPKALAAGLGVGVLALALTVLASPAIGAGEFLALSPASYVAAGASLLLPTWGALVRGMF